jgi:hypothetical protein
VGSATPICAERRLGLGDLLRPLLHEGDLLGRLLGLRLGLLLDFRHERRAPRLFLGDLRLEARDRLIERLGRPPLVVVVVTGILM